MKGKIILWMFVLLVVVQTIAASSCYTIINTPNNNNDYWKVRSYDQISNDLDDWLSQDVSITTPSGLGAGYQYTIRIEDNCFNRGLPSKLGNTGITSNDLNIQDISGDYEATSIGSNDIYTISIPSITTQSTGYVKDLDFTGDSTYRDYDFLCNENFKVTKQLQIIRNFLWDRLEPGEINCANYPNVVECALDKNTGQSIHYATAVATLAQQCGINTKVIHGIVEGNFNGLDISLDNSKEDYWIEFLDDEWHTFQTSEESPISQREYNCRDGIDDDSDGNIDCLDSDCDQEYECQVTWPTTTKFENIYSTDLTELTNPSNVEEIILGNAYGEIKWMDTFLNLADVNIDDHVTLEEKALVVKEGPFDHPAVVKLQTIYLRNPEIRDELGVCATCEITRFENHQIEFTIPGKGIYQLSEESTNRSRSTTDVPIISQSKWYDDPMSSIKNLSTKNKIIGGLAILFLLWWKFIRK